MGKLIKPIKPPLVTGEPPVIPSLVEEEVANKIEEKPVQITAQEDSTEVTEAATVQPQAKTRRRGGQYISNGAGLTRVS
jgi:hypothetical protein